MIEKLKQLTWKQWLIVLAVFCFVPIVGDIMALGLIAKFASGVQAHAD